jgi:hypothetical protein
MGTNKKQTKVEKQNSNGLDQFFTKPKEAKRLYEIVEKQCDLSLYDLFLEPSAGANSFGCLFPEKKSLLLDIDPQEAVFVYNEGSASFDRKPIQETKATIIQADFLAFGETIERLGLKGGRKIIAIGNPPFGKNCSIAVKFFNVCANFCDTICFIIPRTFKRVSIQNQLNLYFHLDFSEDLPFSNSDCVFEPAMNAKCCFQIWKRRDIKRSKIRQSKTHPDWEFLAMGPLEERVGCKNKQPTPPKNANFAMKAYGSNCGEVVTDNLGDLRPKSWHWIKCDNPEDLISRFEQLDYSISEDTVRQNSLGRADLVEIYTKKFGDGLDKEV